MGHFENTAPTCKGPRPGYRKGVQDGFTLIEVVVTSAVLLIGLLTLTMTMVATNSLRRAENDRNLAQNALRSIVEQVHSISDASLDDPAGWSAAVVTAFSNGGTPGDTLPVARMTPPDGVATPATVQIVVNEMLTDAALGVQLGMPRDLDGDGLVDNVDVTNSAHLLPVIVRLRWTGGAGDLQIVHGFFLLGL